MINKIACYLKRHDGFTLISHIAPDGDTLGSAIALFCALRKMGKNVSLVCESRLPHMYAFLPYIGEYNTGKIHENIVTIDCADVERMGKRYAPLAEGCVCIDHHESNAGFGAMALVDTSAAATGELICELIRLLGVGIDSDIAACLYTAISTDTGNFTYSNTSPRCLEETARLVGLIDLPRISRQLYRTRTLAKTMLIKRFLEKLEFYLDGRLAASVITAGDMKECGASPGETESIIDFARDIEGVEVAVFALELRPGEYKIGMRSKEYVNVGQVAVEYGGGGHKHAAGFKAAGAYEALRDELAVRLGKLI